MFHTFIALIKNSVCGKQTRPGKSLQSLFCAVKLNPVDFSALVPNSKGIIYVRYQSVFLRVSTNTAKNRVHGFLPPKKKSCPYFSCLSSMIPIKWILCLLVNFLQHVISIYGCFYRDNNCVISIFNTEETCCKCVFCPE